MFASYQLAPPKEECMIQERNRRKSVTDLKNPMSNVYSTNEVLVFESSHFHLVALSTSDQFQQTNISNTKITE